MSDFKKTAMFVGVASGLFAVVLVTTLWGERAQNSVPGLGTLLFPEFTSPEQAASLRVAEFDTTTGRPQPFEVALRDGRWVIPSHNNYPADARDRLARSAAGLIDLRRDTYRGDRPEDYREMGVVDPLDSTVTSFEGLGKRITLKDKTDRVLADLIIGKPVEGQPGQHYVRVAGQNAVYGVDVSHVDISTRFSDWIDADLMRLGGAKVQKIVFENTKVDDEGRLVQNDAVVASRADTSKLPAGASAWSLDMPIPPGQEVNETSLNDVTSALSSMRIVGVRAKPPGLTADLMAGDGKLTIDRAASRSLADIGFVFYQNRLISQQSPVIVACDDGVVYNLHFGKRLFSKGEALSSGKLGGQAKEVLENPDGENAGNDLVENRFLFIVVRHSPDLVQKPYVHTKDELPDDLFARDKAEREAFDKRKVDDAKRMQDQYEKKIEEGRKRSKELNDRYAAWYYVVPSESYRKIVLEPSALTRPIGQRDTKLPNGLPGQFQGGNPLGQGLPFGRPR